MTQLYAYVGTDGSIPLEDRRFVELHEAVETALTSDSEELKWIPPEESSNEFGFGELYLKRLNDKQFRWIASADTYKEALEKCHGMVAAELDEFEQSCNILIDFIKDALEEEDLEEAGIYLKILEDYRTQGRDLKND